MICDVGDWWDSKGYGGYGKYCFIWPCAHAIKYEATTFWHKHMRRIHVCELHFKMHEDSFLDFSQEVTRVNELRNSATDWSMSIGRLKLI